MSGNSPIIVQVAPVPPSTLPMVRELLSVDFSVAFPHSAIDKARLINCLLTLEGQDIGAELEWNKDDLFKFLRKQMMRKGADDLTKTDLTRSTGFVTGLYEAAGGVVCDIGSFGGFDGQEMTAAWLRERLPRISRAQGVAGAGYWQNCRREYVAGLQGRRIALGGLFEYFEGTGQNPHPHLTHNNQIELLVSYARGVIWAAGKSRA